MTKPATTRNEIEILPADTEALLQGMIREAHAIIREDIRPAIGTCVDLHERGHMVRAAVQVVEIAARVGDTIARLRFGEATEMRQKITVERLTTLKAAGNE